MKREKDLLRLVTDYLAAKKIEFYRMQSGKILGSHKGRSWAVKLCPPGTPDIQILQPAAIRYTDILPGPIESFYRIIWLECKSDRGRPSAEQVLFGSRAIAKGQTYLVVRTLEDVQKVIG